MKGALAVLLAFCLALGVAGGLTGSAPSSQRCPGKMAHCPSHRSAGGDRAPVVPCTASCPICANAGMASLAAAVSVHVSWECDARPADAGWFAEALAYPPPLPPPRLAA